MKKLILIGTALLALAACSRENKDVMVITDFYEAVLGQTEMTDDLLRQSLSQQVLDALWERDYEDCYAYWVFRTEYQEGPSDHSSLDAIVPLGNHWYQVTYSDMGIPGITDLKMEGGKIADYRPYSVPFVLAQGYFHRTDDAEGSLPLKITTEEELLEHFGMAAVMGKNGEPTAIDFEKSFVIPVVLPETERETGIWIQGLHRTSVNGLSLMVYIHRGETQSFTTLPCELLIVDGYYRDYALSVNFEEM